MVIACGYDPQNDVALVTRGARNVAQRLFAAQAHAKYLAGAHALQPEFGAYERHRTNFIGNVDGVVGCRKGRGGRHVPNYTAPAGRCRVYEHA